MLSCSWRITELTIFIQREEKGLHLMGLDLKWGPWGGVRAYWWNCYYCLTHQPVKCVYDGSGSQPLTSWQGEEIGSRQMWLGP